MKILRPSRHKSEIGEEHNKPLKNIHKLFFTTTHPSKIQYTMSVEVYNQLMSNMLNQRCALAKLKAELEGREGRICRRCGRFGHLAWKCKSGEEQRKEKVVANRFEALGSWVMKCGVRKLRRQEIVKEAVRCFGCGEEGHKK